jgi:Na+-transporting methylmalonyl-CoA/oxaloacetate decarboxylase gamma subunit
VTRPWFICEIMYVLSACISMYVTTSAPTRDSLGSVNGLAQTATSFMRAIGPASATSFFAISIEKDFLGGNLAYIVLALLTVLAYGVGELLPKELWPRETSEDHESRILAEYE